MQKDKAIFVWIPKAAGTSLYTVLKEHGCRKLKTPKKFKHFNNSGFVTFGHVDINYLLDNKIIESNYLEDAFKFCFVRNPWDRLVSLYFYLKCDNRISFEEFVYIVRSRHRLQKSFFYSQKLLNYFTGSALIPTDNYQEPYTVVLINKLLKKLFTFSPWLISFFPIPKNGPYNSIDWSQANPQTDWITGHDGNILVDVVYKLENISEDFNKVCNSLGIDTVLPHVNKTDHKNYRSYYNQETKKIVADIYQTDIEMFNYQF
ncbi:hypothetical protein GF340_04195 [Candidatus Peregrinibacteria bacterium]|nr:hypothetical protein [Candidatus Peregrinibacteria bacterium]